METKKIGKKSNRLFKRKQGKKVRNLNKKPYFFKETEKNMAHAMQLTGILCAVCTCT